MSALTPVDIAPAPVERGARALLWGLYPLLVVMVISAIAFMRRNLTLGRGDRAGATRLALLVGVATLLSAALSAAWPSDGLVQTVMSGALSAAMFMAGCCWVFYLAIEPYARRQWPRTLTGWTRFIHGEWRDPLAGRELLIGAAIGMALLAIQRPMVGAAFSLGQIGRSGLELDAYGSVLGALSVGVNQIGSVVSGNLGWIVLLLLARRIIRRDELAVAVASAPALFGLYTSLAGQSVFLNAPEDR